MPRSKQIKPLQTFALVISKPQRRSLCVVFVRNRMEHRRVRSGRWTELLRLVWEKFPQPSIREFSFHYMYMYWSWTPSPHLMLSTYIPTPRKNRSWNKTIIGNNQRRHLIIQQTGDAEGKNPSVEEKEMEHRPQLSAMHYWKQERKRRETSKERVQKDRRAFIFRFKCLTLMIKALWSLQTTGTTKPSTITSQKN